MKCFIFLQIETNKNKVMKIMTILQEIYLKCLNN